MARYERVPSGPHSTPPKTQTWHKKSAYSWSILVICVTCAFVAFYELSQALTYEPKEHISSADKHPIEHLAQKSQDAWIAMIRSQSNDIPSAAHEYRRRYGRNPPEGFAKWFDFAKAHGSLIIDEFDQIHEMLEPFWNISPEELRKSIRAVSTSDSERLGYIKLEGGKVSKRNTGRIQDGLIDLIKDVKEGIPDLEMMVTGVDEPIVLHTTPGSNIQDSGLVPHQLRSEVTWENMRAPCSLRSSKSTVRPTWRNDSSLMISEGELQGLPFVQDKFDALDICTHPEFDAMHDFGRAKLDKTRFVHNGLIPIFSQTALSISSDIIFPSPHYWTDHRRKHDPVTWERKTHNALFWKGATTDGWALQDSPSKHHIRHRLVSFINGLNSQPTYIFLTRSRFRFWSAFTSTARLPSTLYNIAFTKLVQCFPDSICQAEKTLYNIPDTPATLEDLLAEASTHKLVLDVDGNSFSTDYYTLLASNSAVLKLTAHREWHDERLFPWVHYIPVSLSLTELPETVRWLTGTQAGERLAKQVADSGREWGGRMLRRADAQVWTYRLMLEWARVLREDRETIGFDVEKWLELTP